MLTLPQVGFNSFPFTGIVRGWMGQEEREGRKRTRGRRGGVAVWANNIKPKELERRRRGEERRGGDRRRRGKVEEEMHNSFMRWPKGICIFHGTLHLALSLLQCSRSP